MSAVVIFRSRDRRKSLNLPRDAELLMPAPRLRPACRVAVQVQAENPVEEAERAGRFARRLLKHGFEVRGGSHPLKPLPRRHFSRSGYLRLVRHAPPAASRRELIQSIVSGPSDSPDRNWRMNGLSELS